MKLSVFAKLFLAIGLFLGISANASAAWYEASSDNFVIYADDREKDIKRFAQNLEQFHAAMEFLTSRKLEKPSPSNRVTIYVVGNQRAVRRLSGGDNRYVAGFYVPRAGGSTAFVQDIKFKNGYPHFSTVVLLHEYAHHFLMSSSSFAMPRWANEGAAEFFAAATFKSDGGMWIGRPAQHRANDFAFADKVTVRELLDPELYERNKGKGFDAFYAQSWLLYHYLTFSEERQGQLTGYLRGIAGGQTSMQAAQESFGDLSQLQKELRGYLRQRRMTTFALQPDMIPIGDIVLRKLPKGEAEMMDVRMQSKRGVTREQALELLPEAREIAAQFGNDPAVLAALAEAEHDAGNDAEAIAAADRALALDPANKDAHVQKGYSLFRMAADAEPEDEPAAYGRAMRAFSKLNALENDHPLPLIYFYRSYAEQGKAPSENARAALERASVLAPFDHGLAFQTALMQAGEGKIAIATQTIAPVAANPHGGAGVLAARLLMAGLEKAEEGKPFRYRPPVVERIKDEDSD